MPNTVASLPCLVARLRCAISMGAPCSHPVPLLETAGLERGTLLSPTPGFSHLPLCLELVCALSGAGSAARAGHRAVCQHEEWGPSVCLLGPHCVLQPWVSLCELVSVCAVYCHPARSWLGFICVFPTTKFSGHATSPGRS